jgi:hypothetical protein
VFALEIFVRGDPWDSLADPVDVAAHAALMGDAQLPTIVSDLRRIGEAFEAQEADRTAGTLTVRYRATFLTQAGADQPGGLNQPLHLPTRTSPCSNSAPAPCGAPPSRTPGQRHRQPHARQVRHAERRLASSSIAT